MKAFLLRWVLPALWMAAAGSAADTAAPTLLPTYVPTSKPTITPVPTDTPRPSPPPTSVPTHKPTEFPTAATYTLSPREQMIQAIAMLCACLGLGIFLGFGNVKLEWDRAKRKLHKVLEYNAEKQSWREILEPTAQPEELLETIETFKEKFYPGDRVCVLDREIKEEKVDMSRWTKKRKREHFKAIADAKHAVSEEGLLAKADQNGDGQIDAAELEALAKDVPRGRTGVVCKFADDANRVVIEFDEEDLDEEEIIEESDSDDSSSSEEEFDFEEEEDEDENQRGFCTGLLCCLCDCCYKKCCKPKTEAQLAKIARKKEKAKWKKINAKERWIMVRIPKDAKPGMVLRFEVSPGRFAELPVPPSKRGGMKMRVRVPAKGEISKANLKKPPPPPRFSARLSPLHLVGISAPIDGKVAVKYPDRDWDDEELDEIAQEPSALVIIIEMVFFPIRFLLYKMFCEVAKSKKPVIADEETAADRIQAMGVQDQDDEDDMIDGFPIDCGTKDRKFLSMAKCKAITMARHPHLEVVQDGEVYVQPYELWRDTGQHNLECGPCDDLKKSYGCIRPTGIMQNYGIGMSLYFKFTKTLLVLFFFCALAAAVPMTYYWTTSPWNAYAKSLYLENPATADKYQWFFTTIGALGGSSNVCGMGYEDERFQISCQSGVIKRLEAYYGDPFGSCSCPTDQLPLSRGRRAGLCPADPDYTAATGNEVFGKCSEVYPDSDKDLKGTTIPCFQGQMWNGETCCAYGLHEESKTPDFDDIAMMPNEGCNSASAQFILQAKCLNQPNCTIDVKSNVTYEWDVTATSPCGEGTQVWDENSQVHRCSSSLLSPSSNFNECPSNMKDRRLIVRGTCSDAEFESDYFGGGQPQRRQFWSKVMAFIDAGSTFLVFMVVLWMAEKEKHAVLINDNLICSADDYTLRILKLKPPMPGKSPDLDKLKRHLKEHFDTLCKNASPVLLDRPVKVLDINFGLNNQETIQNMKIRGAMARVLDLQVEKLQLMIKYNIYSDKVLQKQRNKVTVLKVKFLQMCQKVKYRKTRLEARTAFITFASEEGFERCRRMYAKRYMFGLPKHLRYRNKASFRMAPVMRPSDYIWENLSTPPVITSIKVIISNLIAFSLLVIGFAAIIKAKGVESSAKLALGETDCTTFEFIDSGEPNWDSWDRFNYTAFQTTRMDVVKNVYADFYNNSYPNAGLLGCYCLAFDNAVDPAVEFRNPYSGDYEVLCGPFFDDYADIQVMSALALISQVVVGELLKAVFTALVAFEGHETITEKLLAHTLKLFGALLMTAAFVMVLIAGNVDMFTSGKSGPATRNLSEAQLLSGTIQDFTSQWYLEVGTAIIIVMYANITALNTGVISAMASVKLTRCLDRGCSNNMHISNQKLQSQLETMYTGPMIKLHERYAALLVGYFVCMIFSPGMPILWVLAFATFWVCFLFDKWAFLRVYRLPPKYGPALSRFVTDMLPIGVLLHVVFAVWTFSQPDLFDYPEVYAEEGSPSTDWRYGDTGTFNGEITQVQGDAGSGYAGPNVVDYWIPDEPPPFKISDPLYRVGEHVNNRPHLVLFVIWVCWFVGTKILDLDELFYICMGCCVKSEKDFALVVRELFEQNVQEAVAAEAKVIAKEEKGAGDVSSDAEEAPSSSTSGVGGGAPSATVDDANFEAKEEGADVEAGRGGSGSTTDANKNKKTKRKDRASFGSLKSREPMSADAIAIGSDPTYDPSSSSLSMGFGAPSGAVDDNEALPTPASPKGGIGTTAAAAVKSSTKKKRRPSTAKGVVQAGPAIVTDADDVHQFDVSGTGSVVQENFKPSEAARFTFDNMMGVGREEGENDASYQKKFDQFLSAWQAESGISGVETFYPGEKAPTFSVAMESMTVDFRDRWLTLCEFVQAHRGRRKVEGNPDYLWAIPSDILTLHVNRNVMSHEMLALFSKELAFRKRNPALYARVTRRLQGIVSYDYNANEDYIDAFALDSKSMRNYLRGNMQVSGEDYELAQKGFWNTLKACILGPRPLDAIFPDISRDVAGIVARHTTQVGVVPTQITGPRFVLNVRVPPVPKDLNPLPFDDEEYDEYAEKWQYLKVYVKGVFDYRLRLPRGLQYRKIPEIQVEIPAFQQTKSAVRTQMIGNEIRSIYEQVEDNDEPNATKDVHTQRDERREARRLEKERLATMQVQNMGIVSDINSAETQDKLAEANEVAAERAKAAAKIQNAFRGLGAKKKVSRMKGWQARTLRFLESPTMAIIAVLLVALDMLLQFQYNNEKDLFDGEFIGTIVGYSLTGFFFIELVLRFHCYAYLARGEGCDCGDLDFFTVDKMRLVDLMIVIVDLAAVFVIVASENPDASGAVGLRFGKMGRVLRIARLARLARLCRVFKLTSFTRDDYRMTGKERIGMQRFHILAPKDVDKGNRLEVSITTLGKVRIQWPLYAAKDCPIQFHLPVVSAHHLNAKIAPNCHIIKPDPLEISEVEYRNTVGQVGWASLWSPLDDYGLGMPPPQQGLFSGRRSSAAAIGGDVDGDGVDDVDENGVPLDARQQHLQRKVLGRDPTGGDEPSRRKTMKATYDKHYDDYRRHRVWYQLMAFAPRTVVKDFSNLRMFQHEIEPFIEGRMLPEGYPTVPGAVLTLKDGMTLGERIETTMRLSQGPAHGQTQVCRIPGVGEVRVRLLATNNVLMPGVHNVDCLTLSVLPWGDKPIDTEEYVPEAIGEITFDYPAILLPPLVEVVKKGMSKKEKEAAAEAQAEKEAAGTGGKGGGAAGDDEKRVLVRKKDGVRVKYLCRDTFVKTFEVKSRARIAVEEALERKRLAKIRAEKGCCGIGKSRAGRAADAKLKRAEEKKKRLELRELQRQRYEAKQARQKAAENKKDGGKDSQAPPEMGLDPAAKKGNKAAANATNGKNGSKTPKAGAPAPRKSIFGGMVGSPKTKAAAAGGKDGKGATAAGGDGAEGMSAAAKAVKSQPSLHPELLDPDSAATPEAAEAIRREKERQEAKLAEKMALDKGMAAAAHAKNRPKVAEEDQSHLAKEMRHIKHENKTNEKLSLPKVGRFDVVWPAALGATLEERHKARMAAFRVNFPAIKPKNNLQEDVKTLIPMPGSAAAVLGAVGVPGAVAPPQRFQVGWVLVECPNSEHENNNFPVYLRLPAFVSKKMRSLAKLPLTDEASPWNTNIDPSKLEQLKLSALSKFGRDPNSNGDKAKGDAARKSKDTKTATASSSSSSGGNDASNSSSSAANDASGMPHVADAKGAGGNTTTGGRVSHKTSFASTSTKGSPANSTTSTSSNFSKRSASGSNRRPRPTPGGGGNNNGRTSTSRSSSVRLSSSDTVANGNKAPPTPTAPPPPAPSSTDSKAPEVAPTDAGAASTTASATEEAPSKPADEGQAI